ncbi:MAG: SulP family inorganic anion transporter [Acidobacteriota bacterium]
MIHRVFPFLAWFRDYSTRHLRADLVSGITVALVLIPQSMAYAQLAGLPAYYGLYAGFLPPLIAALFGSSHQLATGPVAVVSLMTATTLSPLATLGSEGYVAYAVLLALLVGLFQFLLGILRLGMLVNFLSHPVINGFTNAAAIIIATSQLAKLFGVDVDTAEHHYETVYYTVAAALRHTHWPTLFLGSLAFAIMIVLKKINRSIPNVLVAVAATTLISWSTGYESNLTVSLDRIRTPQVQELVRQFNSTLAELDQTMSRRVEASARLKEAERMHGGRSLESIALRSDVARHEVQVDQLSEGSALLREQLRDLRFQLVQTPGGEQYFDLAGTPVAGGAAQRGSWALKVGANPLQTESLKMVGGGAVVGVIPRGLPEFSMPGVDFSVLLDLFTMGAIISLLGFMEAISIAKAMAARSGQRLDPNQELIGQGLANIVSAVNQGYPVSGSFSRSAVNFQSGAVSGLSSAFSSLMVMITLLFLTPLLYHLPQSVLAAIIMMAVIGLVNVTGFIHAWEAQRYDGIISVVTFVATLAFAPHLDRGITIGVVLSLALYLLRTMQPQIAMLSKTPDGQYRDARRRGLETCRHVAVIRFNNSLFFANVSYLEDVILETIASMPELRHILIVGNAINELDASGEVALSRLVTRVRERGLEVSFSGLNDNVIDVMKRTHLHDKIGAERLFGSVAHAVESIHRGSCIKSPDYQCPLVSPRFEAFAVEPQILEELQKRRSWSDGEG